MKHAPRHPSGADGVVRDRRRHRATSPLDPLLRLLASGRSPSRADDTRAGLIRIAQIDLLLGNLAVIVFGTFAASVAVVAITGAATGHVFLAGWFCWIVLLTGGCLVCARRMGSRPTTPDNVESRYRRLLALSSLNALSWGVLGWVSVAPDRPIATLSVLMTLVGLVASASAFIAHFRTMFLLYSLPMMLPMAVRFAIVGHDAGLGEWLWVSALIVLFLTIVMHVSRATSRSTLQSIRLRFTNLDLMESLAAGSEAARAAQARAEQANRAKSMFLSAASHDLRQPLHSLRILTATLAGRVARDDPGAQGGHALLIDQIDRSVQALDGLFGAILDLSRLDAGTLEVSIRHVRLAPLLEGLRRDFEPLAAEKGIVLSVASTSAVVRSDPLLLGRLLGNLVSNAIRYTVVGSVDVRVVCAPEGESGAVSIDILDTGIGIAESDRERIFEEFVQIGNPERDRSRGIGLGLSIVRRTATLLDVDVSLESIPDVGTCFRLRIPEGDEREVVQVAEIEWCPPDTQEMSDRMGLDQLFVLVIDDESDVLEAMEGLLLDWGCSVMGAGSGAEAVALLGEIDERPDVVISDYRLRDGETGSQAIAAVRTACAREALPGIVITGDVDPERLRAIEASGFPVLHKPCSHLALRRLIASSARSG